MNSIRAPIINAAVPYQHGASDSVHLMQITLGIAVDGWLDRIRSQIDPQMAGNRIGKPPLPSGLQPIYWANPERQINEYGVAEYMTDDSDIGLVVVKCSMGESAASDGRVACSAVAQLRPDIAIHVWIPMSDLDDWRNRVLSGRRIAEGFVVDEKLPRSCVSVLRVA